jgi:hypothetical protein
MGDISTGSQRIAAKVAADPTTPLVHAGGHVYWVDTAGTYEPSLGHWSEFVQGLDIATGAITNLAPGQLIFSSADGQWLYIAQMDNASMIELPADGQGAPRRLTLPPGWYLPAGFGVAVVNGILVQSTADAGTGLSSVLAVWNPRSGRVKVLGRGFGAYSEAGSSVLAWMPASCRFPMNCPITITNTVTLASRTLRSPLRYGFALGGAFSPDGRQLAVFVNTTLGAGGGQAELAIVSIKTGGLRLVPEVRLRLGQDIAWARWMPDGKQLIAGSIASTYLVTVPALSALPVRFTRSTDQEINYSATVIPPRS